MTRRPDMKFHLLGAFDRFNYGDLLFAYIGAHIIKEKFPDAEIAWYGTHASDMSDVGAIPTLPMRMLYNRQSWARDANVILVTGGEVLGTPWNHMYEHVLSHASSVWFRRAGRRLGADRMDQLCQAAARCPGKMPWVPSPASFPPEAGRVATLFNSVGGRTVGNRSAPYKEWIRAALTDATWLSVRDTQSATAVTALGVPTPHIAPDSAVIMRDLPLASDAALATSLETLGRRMEAPLVPGEYFAVQCGMKHLSKSRAKLAAHLTALHKTHKLPIIGFAIGRASGHEDQTVAREIAALLGHPDWFKVAPDDMSIQEIMAFIAKTRCYIGTSLHGYITAFAFGTPRVGLSHIGKMIGFRDAWDLSAMPADAKVTSLETAVEAALAIDQATSLDKARTAASIYKQDVDHMWAQLASHLPGAMGEAEQTHPPTSAMIGG